MARRLCVLLATVLECCSGLAIGARAVGAAGRLSLTLTMGALPETERVAAVLLAGGSGKRMGAKDQSGKAMPKQFLELDGKSVLQLSLELLQRVDNLYRLVIVLAPEFRGLDFVAKAARADARIVFADPGKERQNSVENGLAQVGETCTLVAVHDAARPLVTLDEIHRCLADAAEHGAAVLAVPMKATVKESVDGAFVTRTLDRKALWEVHTPQIVRPELLREGFRQCNERNLEVTDDVSVIEQIGKPVKITLGEYTNLKLTTPEDVVIAKEILASRRPKRKRFFFF